LLFHLLNKKLLHGYRWNQVLLLIALVNEVELKYN
jgi:hypothetical protein